MEWLEVIFVKCYAQNLVLVILKSCYSNNLPMSEYVDLFTVAFLSAIPLIDVYFKLF